MSNYNSGLPIRSELSGVDEVVVSRLCDETDKTKQVQVDADKNLHIEAHGNNPAGGDEVLRMSELGHAAVDGVYDATNNSDPSNLGLIAHTRNATPDDTHQVKRVTAITSSTVHALDIALHSHDGSNFGPTNPLYVTSVDGGGTEVNDYNMASAVGAAATDATHIYTVPPGNDFLFKRVLGFGSGKAFFEIQIDPDGLSGYSTIAYGGVTTAMPNLTGMEFAPVQIVAGGLIKVLRTNGDKQAQDLHSTIVGSILA